MAEENQDLKLGEETPEGTDPPEEETTDDPESTEETPEGTEAGEEGGEGSEEGETVKISKSELEGLQKKANEGENYRKAVIRLNRDKGRSLPGSEPEKNTKPKPSEDGDGFEDGGEETAPKGDFVTKQDLAVRDEKKAISKACENEQTALNWDDIVGYYQKPKDNSYESILEAINRAKRLWRADKGIAAEEPKEDDEKKAKQAKQDLGADAGKNKGKEKLPVEKKKSILQKNEKMEDWYKD